MSKEVKRWDELKALAEGMDGWPNKNAFEFDDAWCVGAIDEDENLWPVIEIQTEQYDAFDAAEPMAKYYAAANPTAILKLLAERDALLAERDAARMRVKELDLLFGRYLLAMKAAVIDEEQRGAEQGMRWIYNSLAGPGELPAEDEIDAQAFFDREIKQINEAMAELLVALQGAQP